MGLVSGPPVPRGSIHTMEEKHKGKSLARRGRRARSESLLLRSPVLTCPKPQSLAFKMRMALIVFPAGRTAQKHSTAVRASPFPPLLPRPLLTHSECHPPPLGFMLAQALRLPCRTHPSPSQDCPTRSGWSLGAMSVVSQTEAEGGSCL